MITTIERINMVERIISECEQALEHGPYLAALNLALILPDICGKAEYPGRGTKSRYIAWYDEYIGQYEKYPPSPTSNIELPYPSGEVIYSLRCSCLHQGTPTIDKERCQIEFFSLIYETTKPLSSYIGELSGSSPAGRDLTLHINMLCWRICTVAKQYYENHKEQFDFFNYRLIDGDVSDPQNFDS